MWLGRPKHRVLKHPHNPAPSTTERRGTSAPVRFRCSSEGPGDRARLPALLGARPGGRAAWRRGTGSAAGELRGSTGLRGSSWACACMSMSPCGCPSAARWNEVFDGSSPSLQMLSTSAHGSAFQMVVGIFQVLETTVMVGIHVTNSMSTDTAHSPARASCPACACACSAPPTTQFSGFFRCSPAIHTVGVACKYSPTCPCAPSSLSCAVAGGVQTPAQAGLEACGLGCAGAGSCMPCIGASSESPRFTEDGESGTAALPLTWLSV